MPKDASNAKFQVLFVLWNAFDIPVRLSLCHPLFTEPEVSEQPPPPSEDSMDGILRRNPTDAGPLAEGSSA